MRISPVERLGRRVPFQPEHSGLVVTVSSERDLPGPAQESPPGVEQLGELSGRVDLPGAAVTQTRVIHPHLVDVEQHSHVARPRQYTDLLVLEGLDCNLDSSVLRKRLTD